MKVEEFIGRIFPDIIDLAIKGGYKFPRAMMAQAIVESWCGDHISTLGDKYHNYWGMYCGSSWKGMSVNLKTKEIYTPGGPLVNTKQNFRAWKTPREGVEGYFQFINYARYKNVKSATCEKDYIERIWRSGWCVNNLKYVDACMNRLKLVPVDWKNYAPMVVSVPIVSTDSSLDGVAHEVIRGVWGNGLQRKNRLTLAGYDYTKVQARVNEILRSL